MSDSTDIILGNLDTFVISGATDNMGSGQYTYTTDASNTSGVYTVTLDPGILSDSIDLTGITPQSIGSLTIDDIKSWNFGPIGVSPFDDCFPEWDDFQSMCKEYPGLEKCYEHLKAFYKLCKDEWEQKKKGEI